MENNRGSKAKNFLQKMYHFRVKVNKQDKAIANVSSIFALACLIFAPHMTVVGVVASLLMGYQIRFESEDMDDTELEERIRKAAQNVKTGAMNAAKSIQTEINKARTQNTQARTQAEAEKAAEKIVEQAAAAAAETAQQAASSNEELLKDLQSRVQETMESNPAATTFHSAYAASAGSVPVLRVNEEPADAPEPDAPAARGSAE